MEILKNHRIDFDPSNYGFFFKAKNPVKKDVLKSVISLPVLS
jgi:hypothetical protein